MDSHRECVEIGQPGAASLIDKGDEWHLATLVRRDGRMMARGRVRLEGRKESGRLSPEETTRREGWRTQGILISPEGRRWEVADVVWEEAPACVSFRLLAVPID